MAGSHTERPAGAAPNQIQGASRMTPASRSNTKPASLCRLREWRTTRGLTLQVTADLTGYDRSTVSRLERGQVNLRPLAKVDFARRLGARLAEIFPVDRQQP